MYVYQLKGFFIKGQEDKVYKLKKILYGLKQTLRIWYNRLHLYLSENKFEMSENELTLYIKKEGK